MSEYFSMFGQYLPLLLGGLRLTILIAIFGIIIAVVLGVVVCIMQLCHIKILNRIATLYVTIIRGMPLMILAFTFLGPAISGNLRYVFPIMWTMPVWTGIFCLEMKGGARS